MGMKLGYIAKYDLKLNPHLTEPFVFKEASLMDKDYVCNDCGAAFSVPDKRTYRENLDGENGFMTVVEFRCPFCGSEEIEEAD